MITWAKFLAYFSLFIYFSLPGGGTSKHMLLLFSIDLLTITFGSTSDWWQDSNWLWLKTKWTFPPFPSSALLSCFLFCLATGIGQNISNLPSSWNITSSGMVTQRHANMFNNISPLSPRWLSRRVINKLIENPRLSWPKRKEIRWIFLQSCECLALSECGEM